MRIVAVRVDKWLWSVRVYKTRSKATAACTSGRVLVNDEIAKPATHVRPGDMVTAKRRDRVVVYVVVEPISKRVSAKLAPERVDDRSPPPEPATRRGAGAGRARYRHDHADPRGPTPLPIARNNSVPERAGGVKGGEAGARSARSALYP